MVRATSSTCRSTPPAEAEQVAAAPPGLPDRDETALPFFTVDPPGSMDLDQAMHFERDDGDGHRIRVRHCRRAEQRLWGALDRLPRERGQTVHCPDVRVPLHPEVGGRLRMPCAPPSSGTCDSTPPASSRRAVYRAMVRSVERLDYAHVQAAIHAGTDDERFLMLREIGERRIAQERLRAPAPAC